LRTRAVPEQLRGVITTRHYTNPRLPFTYTAGLIDLIEGYGLHSHLYADYLQIQMPTSSSSSCQLAWTKCLTGCGQIATLKIAFTLSRLFSYCTHFPRNSWS